MPQLDRAEHDEHERGTEEQRYDGAVAGDEQRVEQLQRGAFRSVAAIGIVGGGSTCPETASRDAVRAYHARMTLDADAAYLALKARDARFDGRLYVGVTSTGIYCRPICRVRTPRRENCRFFETAAQAERERFRPCMKCRPEVAPGAVRAWSVMDASRTLAHQAAEDARQVRAPRLRPRRLRWPRWRRGSASATAICAASSLPSTA